MIKQVRQIFTEGMNQDMSPAAVDMSAPTPQTIALIQTAQNFNFVRGLLVSRPVLTNLLTAIGLNDTLLAATNPPQLSLYSYGGGNSYNIGPILLTQDNNGNFKIRQILCQKSAPSILTYTGPAINGAWDNFFLNCAVVNSSILLAGYSQGLIRLDPTAGTYTVMNSGAATAPYGFVTKLYSQAIGAFKTNSGSPNLFTDPYTVAWSVPGNEQDWTTQTNGAGSSVLSDLSDDITGVQAIEGMIVVCRRYGFHLGFPTGTFPNLFNFSPVSDDDIGVAHSSSLAKFQNTLYFASDAGIHTFSPSKGITDIGEGIYQEINGFLQIADIALAAAPALRGLISRSYTNDFRPTYNLFLDFQNTVANSQHWQFDIREQKWSKHSYTAAPFFLFPMNRVGQTVLGSQYNRATFPQIGFLPTTLGANTNVQVLDGLKSAGLKHTSDLSFTTGQLSLDPAFLDAQLSRIMIVYSIRSGTNTDAQPPVITVNAQILNGAQISATFTPNSDSLNVNNGFLRLWYAGRVAGNLFTVTVTFPAAGNAYQPITVKELWMEFSDQGTARS